MAPRLSFAPFGGGALTNGIYGLNDAKTGGLGVNGSAYVVPTRDDERRRIYEAGRARCGPRRRRPSGAAARPAACAARTSARSTTEQRRAAARRRPHRRAPVRRAPGEGAALVDWCRRRLLLSLPGATSRSASNIPSSASLVVRGGIKEEGGGGAGDGLAAERRLRRPTTPPHGGSGLASTSSFGTPACAAAATAPSSAPTTSAASSRRRRPGGADVIARRGGDYVYQTLTRDFVAEYWHRLFAGQAALYSDWSSLTSGSDALSAAPPRRLDARRASRASSASTRRCAWWQHRLPSPSRP